MKSTVWEEQISNNNSLWLGSYHHTNFLWGKTIFSTFEIWSCKTVTEMISKIKQIEKLGRYDIKRHDVKHEGWWVTSKIQILGNVSRNDIQSNELVYQTINNPQIAAIRRTLRLWWRRCQRSVPWSRRSGTGLCKEKIPQDVSPGFGRDIGRHPARGCRRSSRHRRRNGHLGRLG